MVIEMRGGRGKLRHVRENPTRQRRNAITMRTAAYLASPDSSDPVCDLMRPYGAARVALDARALCKGSMLMEPLWFMGRPCGHRASGEHMFTWYG